jgi:maltose O-acetyltransferase
MNGFLKQMASLVAKACRDPLSAIDVGAALARGTWYILRYSLFNKRIRIGFPFRAFGPVTLKGPGYISIEKGCGAYSNMFDGLTIVTLNDRARVTIGKKSRMGGLTIRCANNVRIGGKLLTSASLIQDSIMVNPPRQRSFANAASLRPLPVSIGNNVWLCGQASILRGSRIGNDTVVSVGSITHDKKIGENLLVMGGPSSTTLPIDKLMAWEKRS